MWRVNVLTEWQLVGDRYMMRSAVEYPGTWSDATGQLNVMPDPNALVAYGEITEAQVTALQTNANYVVLTAEEITDGKISSNTGNLTAAERTAWLAWLQSRSVDPQLIGPLVRANRSRTESVQALANWLKERPKGR